MFLQNRTRKISRIYHEYPRTFRNVVVNSFIDHIGNATPIFPFFALYLTSKFGIGMTQMGVSLPLSGFGVSGSTTRFFV